jgi:hypothetical protein
LTLRDERFYWHSYATPDQRHIWEHMIRRTTSHYPMARRDPIFTPLFTAIFTSVGFSAATAATLASVATAITVTAISIGIQALMAPKPPKPESGKAPKTQSVPYVWWGVGRNRMAGAYMMWDARGDFLYAVQAIAGHKVKSFNRYWLHSDEVELDVNGYTTNDGGGRYGNNVRILHRLGEVVETPYANLVADLSSFGVWTNNHVGHGTASLAMVAESAEAKNQSKRYPFGPPQLSAEVDCALVWDPRDGAQSPDNPATWQWSRNSALVMLWHQCFNPYGHRRDYHRAILPVVDMWKEEADVCDEDVILNGGGFEPRYECNGFDTTENDPKAATNAILASCDGWISDRGDGALLFTVGKFREDRVVTLSDADLVGHQIQYDVLFEDEINRIVPKFTYPEIAYGESDTDFFEDEEAQVVAGRVLSQEADYRWVQRWRQARRLGKRDWLRVREKKSGSLNVRLSGLNAVHARWIRMQTPLSAPSLDGLIIENRRSTLSLLQGGFLMEFVQNPEDIDAWNPVIDEGQQPPVPTQLASDEIPTPVINLLQSRPYGDSVYIKVVIVDPAKDSLVPVVRYRVANTGGGVPGSWVEQPLPGTAPVGGYITLNTTNVPLNTTLDIEVAFQGSNGSYGPWSVTSQVDSTVDTVAPIALLSFAVTNTAPRLGRANISLTTGNDSHLRSVNLYRVAHGAAFDPATSLKIATLAVGPNGSYTYIDGDDTRVNLLTDGDFSVNPGPWTLGTGWTIASGVATHVTPTQSQITQPLTLTPSAVYRCSFDASGYSGSGFVAARFQGGTNVIGPNGNANGSYKGSMTAGASSNVFAFNAPGGTNVSVDNAILYLQTATTAPQGDWDYYASPFNGSDVIGPSSGPVNAVIL